MKLVSYHFDHKSKRSILGYQYLQLGYHNGLNFFPVDFDTSKNRPDNKIKQINKKTNGYKGRQKALQKKTDLLLNMLQRAMLFGIDTSFILSDSWSAHDALIDS